MKQKRKHLFTRGLILLLSAGLLLTGCGRTGRVKNAAGSSAASDISDISGIEAITSGSTQTEQTGTAITKGGGESVSSRGQGTASGQKATQSPGAAAASSGGGPSRTNKPTGGQKSLASLKTGGIGFGFYCVNVDTYGFDTKWKDLASSDYVNTMFVDSTEFLDQLKTDHVRIWYGVTGVYDKIRNGVQGWQEDFDAIWQGIKNSGHSDVVLGWYLDEPSSMAAVKTITQYAKTKYNKRFFICFDSQATDYTVYGGYVSPDRHISKDSVQYLTDIAVDHYWDVTTQKASYDKLYKSLHDKKPANAKMWYIGNTSGDYSLEKASSTELQAEAKIRINQIDYMYTCLKNEPAQNRGGVLCFAYDYNSSSEKLYGLWNINHLTNNAWNSVYAECTRIGREICSGKIG